MYRQRNVRVRSDRVSSPPMANIVPSGGQTVSGSEVEVWVFFHAETEDNVAGVLSGHREAELSERGKEQARRLGDRYRDQEFGAIYCSDSKRARDTARLMFQSRGLSIIEDNRLRETTARFQRSTHCATNWRNGPSGSSMASW